MSNYRGKLLNYQIATEQKLCDHLKCLKIVKNCGNNFQDIRQNINHTLKYIHEER